MKNKFDFARSEWACSIARNAAEFIIHSQHIKEESFVHEPLNALHLAIMNAIRLVEERLNAEYKEKLVPHDLQDFHQSEGFYDYDREEQADVQE